LPCIVPDIQNNQHLMELQAWIKIASLWINTKQKVSCVQIVNELPYPTSIKEAYLMMKKL